MIPQRIILLDMGLTFLVIFALFSSTFPSLALAATLASSESLPCKTDSNCVLGTYCSSNKCIDCAKCSLYYRQPKPDGGRQCARSFSECGGCMSGYTFKEESDGRHSRRCFPIKDVFPELKESSPTVNTTTPDSESSSNVWKYLISGGSIVIVACVAVFVGICGRVRSSKSTNNCVERAEYHQQPPTAPYLVDVQPPTYEDSTSIGNRATEPLLSVPDPSRSFVTQVTCEKEYLNKAEVLHPPNYRLDHRRNDEGELVEDDDLGEEDAHSYSSAVTETVDNIDHFDAIDYPENGAGSDTPLQEHEGINSNAVVESHFAQVHRSPRSRFRWLQRAASEGALRHVPVPGISSVQNSTSQLDLSFGSYVGIHVNRNGRWRSLRSLHPAAEDSVVLPLPRLDNTESGSEDGGFISSLGGASSVETSYNSLPRAEVSSFHTSADSGILEEQHEITLNKEQTDQSFEGTGSESGEAPMKRLRRDLEDEGMSTVVDIADLQDNLIYSNALLSQSGQEDRQ